MFCFVFSTMAHIRHSLLFFFFLLIFFFFFSFFFKTEQFAQACGLDLPELTQEGIVAEVTKLIASVSEEDLLAQRYGLKNTFLGTARKQAPLKFADPAAVVAQLTAQLEAKLGKESDPINKIQKPPAKKVFFNIFSFSFLPPLSLSLDSFFPHFVIKKVTKPAAQVVE